MQETISNSSFFLDLIYGKILGRRPDAAGATAISDALTNGQSAYDVLESMVTSEEVRNRKTPTTALAQVYQEMYLLPDDQRTVSLDSVLDSLNQHHQKRYFDDDPGVTTYAGSIWIDRGRGKISGWLMFPGSEKEKITVRLPGSQNFTAMLDVIGGVALLDIPLSVEVKANKHLFFDAEKSAIVLRESGAFKNQAFVPRYYATQYDEEDRKPFQHFVEEGFDAGFLPNPFFLPDVVRKKGVSIEEVVALSRLSEAPFLVGLIDIDYCMKMNDLSASDAVLEATNRVIRNDWVHFHPLLSEVDFERSEFDNIIDWLRVICDGSKSLVDMEFNRFSPVHYRNTCSQLEYENELIDYLFGNMRETGEPHVFFNSWFATQHLPHDFDWPSRDLWSDTIVSPEKYHIAMSPFWDPLTFQHTLVTEHDVATSKEKCALDLFLEQEQILVAPTGAVLPSAVVHSFLGRPLKDCENINISGRDIIKALEHALSLKSEMPTKPKLSVCILNYNKLGFSILSAIAAATNTNNDVEVLVLDNGSSPMDFAAINRYTRNVGNVKVVRSQKNLYFGEGNNVLIDMARGETILFLNNDAFVGPQTIDDMLDHLDKTPDASAVGPTFLFPNLEIQEAGGTISNCGRQVQLHKHTSFADHVKYMPKAAIEGVQYVSAACVCIRREVFQDIGGFDYMYEPFYFEDTDMCKRMESLGYRLDYLPASFVIHFENASTREFLSTGFMSQIEKNRMKFQGRWLYKTEGFKPRSLAAEVTAPVDPKRKTAVVYTPFDISIGGGERYILSCALALSRKYNVILCGNQMVSDTRISFVMSDLGLESPGQGSIRTEVFENIEDWGSVEVMIAMGNEVIPPVPFNAKVNIFHCQYPFPSHHSDRFEVSRLRNVDAYFVNSEYTKRKVIFEQEQLSFDIPVMVTGAPVRAPEPGSSDATTDDENDILKVISVGRFEPLGHSKRQDITIEIFREFHSNEPDAELTLVGSVGTVKHREEYVVELQKKAQALPITFDVDAPSALLDQKMKEADVLIHSCGFGIDVRSSPERLEHFGIVILEAMANGAIPLVYSAGGPAEIVNRFGVGYTFSTVSEAAEKLYQINQLSKQERAEISARAKEAAATFFDDAFQMSILKEVDGLVKAANKN